MTQQREVLCRHCFYRNEYADEHRRKVVRWRGVSMRVTDEDVACVRDLVEGLIICGSPEEDEAYRAIARALGEEPLSANGQAIADMVSEDATLAEYIREANGRLRMVR
jgi:hypothetical protein